MKERLHFEDLQVGDQWCSRARTITEGDIASFASLTGDYDPLHVDREYASRSPFGRPIAHGLLGLSFVAGLSSDSPAVNTAAFLGIREWDFLRPAFVGDTVHAVTVVVDLHVSSRRHGRVTWLRQLVNHKGEVIQKGVFQTLVATSAGAKPPRREAPASNRTPLHHVALQPVAQEGS